MNKEQTRPKQEHCVSDKRHSLIRSEARLLLDTYKNEANFNSTRSHRTHTRLLPAIQTTLRHRQLSHKIMNIVIPDDYPYPSEEPWYMDFAEKPGVVRYPISSVRDDRPDADLPAPSLPPPSIDNKSMQLPGTIATLSAHEAPGSRPGSSADLVDSAGKLEDLDDMDRRDLLLNGPASADTQRQADASPDNKKGCEAVDSLDTGFDSDLEVPSSIRQRQQQTPSDLPAGPWFDEMVQSEDESGRLIVFMEEGKSGEGAWRYPCQQQDHRGKNGEECRKLYTLHRDLVRHIANYKKNPVCPECGTSFSRSDALVRHQREACGEQKGKRLRAA